MSNISRTHDAGPVETAHSSQNGQLASHTGVAGDKGGFAPADIPSYSWRDYGEQKDFDWQKFISVLLRRRRLVLTTFGVVVGLGIFFTLISPKEYRAESDILVKSPSSSSMSQMADSMPALSGLLQLTQGSDQDTEVEIVKSSSVVNRALGYLTPQQRASLPSVDQMSKTIEVQPVRDTDVIEVAVTSRGEKLSMDFTNALCAAYLDESQEYNSAVYRDTAAYVKTQMDQVGGQLEHSRAALRDYKQQAGIVDLTTEEMERVQQLGDLTTSLDQAQSEQLAGTAELGRLSALANSMSPTEVQTSTTEISPAVQAIQAQLTALEVQKVADLQEYQPDSPEVQSVEDQIAALNHRLVTEAKTQLTSSNSGPNPIREQINESIAQLSGQNWANQSRAKALQGQIQVAKAGLTNLPAEEFTLGQLQTDLDDLMETYEALQDKYQTLRISEKAPSANARVISVADEATKVKPKPVMNLILSILLGSALAVGLAAFADYLDDGVHSEEDAWEATHLPVLAHVPALKSDEHSLIATAEGERHSGLLETYRMLRTRLAFTSVSTPIRSIVITSAQPHEGKTTTAVNLAIALALNGKSVILLDCDLRRPTVHKVFNRSKEVGFTHVVAGMASLDDVILDTPIEGLKIVTAGPTPPNPPELLDSVNAREIIQQLKARADYLIVDVPPALLLADAQIVGQLVDGVLLVVSCKDAGKRAVSKVTELLVMSGIRLIGSVLTKVPHEENRYYGYGGYGRYGYSVIKSYDSYLEAPKED